jgi:ribonuclease P protein component
MRLSGGRAFGRVYRARVNHRAGPLLVWARPNGLEVVRLGMSVGRRAGGAVRRNRIKRLLREGFRLDQHGWPRGYDVVVGVAAHEPLPLQRYRELLEQAVQDLHQRWQRRGNEE